MSKFVELIKNYFIYSTELKDYISCHRNYDNLYIGKYGKEFIMIDEDTKEIVKRSKTLKGLVND